MPLNIEETYFIKQIKSKYPFFWAKFYEYLRDNFEFWEQDNKSSKTLWFCARDIKTQYGYFIQFYRLEKEKYFNPININLSLSINSLEEDIIIIASTLNTYYKWNSTKEN